MRIFPTHQLSWLVTVVCLTITTALWAAARFPGAMPPNFLPWRGLSQLTALWSVTLMAIAMIAVVRAHAFEPVFGGLDRAVRFHRIVGPSAIVLLIVLRNFRDITEYVVFVAIFFYGLTVAAVYALRLRLPDAPRPFRCIGYPVTPAIFLAVVAFVDYRTLTRQSILIYAAVIFALIYVHFFGATRMGAKRWIAFGGFSLQPSEFARLSVALALAMFYGERGRSADSRQCNDAQKKFFHWNPLSPSVVNQI